MGCKYLHKIVKILLPALSVGLLWAQQVVWPKPPDKARIVLEQIISDPDDFQQKIGFWGRVKKFFSDEGDRRFIRPIGIDVNKRYLAVADPGAGGVFLFDQNERTYLFLTVSEDDHILFTPIDVALGADRLYVTNPASPGIMVFNYHGDYLKTIQPEFASRRPTGITLLDGRLYFADTPLHQIVGMETENYQAFLLGRRGTGIGEFNFPTFVTVSAEGRLYITDTMNFRIQSRSPAGEWSTPLGGRGLMSGQLNRPKGIAVDRAGRVYVVDNSFDNIQVFSPEGEFLLPFGSSGHLPGEFLMPTDIAIFSDLIYVTDTMNNRIQIFRKLYE